MRRAAILALSFATAVTVGASGAYAQSPTGMGQGGPPQGAPGAPGAPNNPPATSAAPTSVDMGARQTDAHKFFEKAAIANMAEITLGQLAVERAQSTEVRQYGQMMVDEHTKAFDALKQAAQAANVTLPADIDGKHQKKVNTLSKLNGAEFDRKYIDAMVDAHKDVASLLKDESKQALATTTAGTSGTTATTSTTGTSGTERASTTSAGTSGTMESGGAQAAQWAAITLPSVQQHLDRATQLQQSLKDTGKTTPSAAPATMPPSGGDTIPPSGTGATPPPTGRVPPQSGSTPPQW